MNHLCVCQYGHSRSVALCRVLHHINQPAIAVGWQTSGTGLMNLARNWSEKILILDDSYLQHIPADQRFKVVSFHVGPDRWSNPYNDELRAILIPMVVEKLGFARELWR